MLADKMPSRRGGSTAPCVSGSASTRQALPLRGATGDVRQSPVRGGCCTDAPGPEPRAGHCACPGRFLGGEGPRVGPRPSQSRAGMRVVTIPRATVEQLRLHLDQYVAADAEALVFTGPKGAAAPRELQPARELAGRGRQPRSKRPPLPRPPAHRKQIGRGIGRFHERPDDPNGPRQHARRADLPARDHAGGPSYRPGPRQADQQEPPCSSRRGSRAALRG